MRWYELGKDPDYRFSLANERTFLAWIRTAIAVLAGAIVLHGLVSKLGLDRSFAILSLILAAMSALLGIFAYFKWRRNELAMRLGRPLAAPVLMLWVVMALLLLGTGTMTWIAMN